MGLYLPVSRLWAGVGTWGAPPPVQETNKQVKRTLHRKGSEAWGLSQLFALIHGDRRARVHIFSPLPVNALYDLLPADVWHQFVPHRHKLVDITADLVSATLSRALVRLDSVMSVHHEAGDDGPSLDSVLTRLPVSSTCCVTESRGGILRVVKAWPSLDPTLVSFTIQPPGGKCDIEGLIQHYEELRVHQYSVLIENMQRSRGQMHHVHNLEEVCHLLGPYLKDPADDDDPSESVSNLKAKRSVKSAPTGRSRPATSVAAPVSARGTTSGSRRLPLMPIELARALHARFNHSGKHRLMRVLELFGWLDIYTLPLKIPCAACAVAGGGKHFYRSRTTQKRHTTQAPHRGAPSRF